MALLPQDPRDQKRFLGILGALVVLVLFWMYVYSPTRTKQNELEDRVAQIQFQNRQAEARTGNLDKLREELAHDEGLSQALQKLVPSKAEVPQIYEAIAQQSQSLGLELQQVVPSSPKADSGSYYLHQDWEMRIKGDYQSVGQFLTRVASFDRIVRPEVTEIRPAEQTPSGRQLVTASFGLESFVIPPDTTGNKSGSSGKGAANDGN
jgi:type IV pilus assembly protein PilO